MEGRSSEARVDGASGNETQQAARAPQPKKKKPEDFKFGKILGEGSFSTVRIHTLESYLWAACNKLLWFANIHVAETELIAFGQNEESV